MHLDLKTADSPSTASLTAIRSTVLSATRRLCATWHVSVLAALPILLIAAISLVIYGSTRPMKRTFHGKLVELLPEAPEGWTRIFQSIADTPELQKKADELLNFDDAVFVDYSRGDSRLSVYIAYWSPGRMSHRLIAGHTPDVCWVGSGWKCIERGRNTMARKINSSSSPQLTRHFYLPAETRTFSAHGITEYVWFWHLVGGKNISYGTNAEPPWFATLSDIVDNGLNQREEQFFIRLSSPNPLGYSDLSPILEMVLESLPLYSNNNKYQVLRTKLNVDFLHSRLIASGGNPID